MGRIKRFFSNTAGNVAMMTVLLSVPLLGAAGLAIDYTQIIREQSQIQQASDAAILAGVRETQRLVADGVSKGQARKAGEALASDVFSVNSTGRNLQSQGDFVPRIEFGTGGIEGKGEFSGSKPTNLLGIVGFNAVNVAVSSSVKISPPEFTEIHFVIDNSQSMGVGATAADIRLLEQAVSCGFACHEPIPGPWPDQRPAIAASGAKTKLNVARDALDNILNQMMTKNLGNTVTVGVHALSNSLQTLANPTSNLSDVQARIAALDLADTANEGGTIFAESFGNLEKIIGNSGDGSQASSPRKIVVFVTDGVNSNVRFVQLSSDPADIAWGGDPNYVPFEDAIDNYVPKDNPNRGALGPFDPNLCSRIKNVAGVTIYTIHTEYVTAGFDQALLSDENVMRLGKIGSEVVPKVVANLEKCASSPGNAFEATDGPELEKAFEDLINRIFANDLKLTG